MSNTSITIQQLKSENQDYEWYPTTKEILQAIACDIKSNRHDNDIMSILDIGAGDGSSLNTMADILKGKTIIKYAIEKSEILISKMNPDIYIIGTDFNNQTLIDKQVDVIFCSPPYSEYTEWAEKIINESNCRTLYLVIPRRWKDNDRMKKAIDRRNAFHQVIGSFNFIESEYRQARAEIDIIRIWHETVSYFNTNLIHDPFDLWFEDNFKFNTDADKYKDKEDKKQKIHEIVKGQNLIESLVELYKKEFDNLINNYRKLGELDSDILKELDVNVKGLREGLKLKISGLKNLYWNELFENLKVITNRLTSKYRKLLCDELMYSGTDSINNEKLKKMNRQTSIDFTIENIYAVILWVIKNSNKYIDKQIKDVYESLSCKENIENYKSNHVMYDDEWRYNMDLKHEHKVCKYRLKLDYRLVVKRSKTINTDYSKNKLTESAIDFLNDIMIVAENLGFTGCEYLPIVYSDQNNGWEYGTEYEFKYNGGVLMACRFYKNGNMHIKPNQEFIRKFNVEAARLNGWIKSPREYADETGESFDKVSKDYGCNLVIQKNNIGLLAEVDR